MCVDLHLHSIYSDGTASPSELAAMAAQHSLSAISLTDHDTVEGTFELQEQARRHNLTVIPGLEISADHDGTPVHILGYGIDPASAELQQWLIPLQEGRSQRNARIISKMRQLGHVIGPDELRSVSGLGQAGRPHIARLLVDKGIVSSINEAFTRYLRRGGSAWFGRFAYSTAESIAMIHRAGGLAVLAHPGQILLKSGTLPLLIARLADYGLDGLEVYYPAHQPAVHKRLKVLARKYALVVTGGSDYHGHNKKYSVMAGEKGGFCPPDSILHSIRARLDLRRAPNHATT